MPLRFEENRVYSGTPESLCPGGLTFEECDAAQALMRRLEHFKQNPMYTALRGIAHAVHPVKDELFVQRCETCQQECTLVIGMDKNMERTGEYAMEFNPAKPEAVPEPAGEEITTQAIEMA